MTAEAEVLNWSSAGSTIKHWIETNREGRVN
jgi:hypothetical protein